jgi:hypothetical protein
MNGGFAALFDQEVIGYICDKVFKDAILLDVLYLITQAENGISKIDILREYQSCFNITPGSQKYRPAIEEAIATLVGTTFVSYYKEGTANKYFLTENGELAAAYMGEFLQKNPDLLKTSKIIPKGEMA